LGEAIDRAAIDSFPADFELDPFGRFAFFEAGVQSAFEAQTVQDARQMRRESVSPAAEHFRSAAEKLFIFAEAALDFCQDRLVRKQRQALLARFAANQANAAGGESFFER